MARLQPINIGDTFRAGERILEVIGTKPGGKVELMDRDKCQFVDMRHSRVRTFERVNQ
jgi:hypothetical protein